MHCIVLHAQKNCNLVIVPVDSAASQHASQLKTTFPTKAACLLYTKQLPALLMAQGYISASVDSVYQDSSAVYMNLFVGEKYLWDDIRVNESDWLLLNQLGFNKASFHNKPFNQAIVVQLYSALLDYFADNGYPFAKITMDSVALQGDKIDARLNIAKGYVYHIDTVIINGSVKISRNFIYRYLDIKPHDIYIQGKLDKITKRLAELPYLEQYQPWSLTMLNKGSAINLYLQPRRSNQINVLVGFLPANADAGGRLLLTGDAALNLRNPFGSGETIGVNWQQLQAGSPKLNLVFQRPYMFKSPFGLNFNFELYKQDSSYLNINTQLGLQYVLSASQSGSVFIQSKSTTVLNVDTATVILTKQLPDAIDMSTISFGLQYSFNNTNYRFNPLRGNELQLTMAFGNKTIKRSNAILNITDTTFNYASLYDTLKLHSYIFSARVSAAHYFPTGRQSTLKAAINAGWYQSPNYFQNELFQIGGYKLLRGFDEESIYTNRFVVGTAEYRYLLGLNSYLFGFTDVGWAKYQTIDYNLSHTYIGAGLGLAFETKGGVINLSFAAGRQDSGSFDLAQLKIHIGFLSVF
jgi:outer membrane protein assembly factor BamA